ncbi:hypothetical protein GCM10010967_48970 [Dyadobacter beijingensis]|uniref:Glycosyltransferase RgtA/B/C/D-like domain-containing protein n=1 Tax=Dyadobacter beijingensis TaxID=365489 RepID=A0ABQ2ID78_9BACT|nr:glycosyltransferase family 39 protein [Dyadobacter beijingensis]GGN07633.1 hypothetical protein GCM10010967_48970 [Dyadobacter beijingensis]
MNHLNAGKAAKYPPWLPWLFTLSFLLITFLPRSLDGAMFMDGTTYAAIARNMAEGQGSFWRPFFAHSFWLPYDNADYFSGHPPLQFWLQSLLFRLLGDTPAVENIYNLVILILYISLIISIWKKLFNAHHAFRAFSWLPVLCWHGMVIVWYSIPNNFLDSTMGLFSLASCYFQLVYLKKRPAMPRDIGWIVLAGIGIVLALLTKGPVGLFPMAFSVIYALTSSESRISLSIRPTVIMLGVVVAAFACLLAYTPAREFLTTYFNGQVVQALLQKREKAGTGWTAHFTLLAELLRCLYPHLFASAALYALSLGLKWRFAPNKTICDGVRLTAFVAASCIVPMLVSIKQYPHYLLPALPFIAITFALLIVRRLSALMTINNRLTIIAFIVGSLACWGAASRKLATIRPDVHVSNAKALRTLVPSAATIGICHDLFQHADIHANFQRYHHLSLTTQIGTARYVLADSACLPSFDLKRDSLIRLHGKFFLVIRRDIHTDR